MDLKTIPLTAIGVAIAVLIVSVVAVPILSDSQTMITSQANNTNERYMSIFSNEKVILSESEDGAPLINGIPISDFAPSLLSYYLVISDKLIARCITNSGILSSWSYSGIASDGTVFNLLQSTTVQPIICTFENGTYNFTKGSTNYTGTYSNLLVPSKTGTYGAYYPSSSMPLYANDDTTIYVVKAASSESYVSSGTIDDIKTSFHIVDNAAGDQIQIGLTSTVVDSNGMDIYKITGLEIPAGYTYIFAPISYTIISDGDNSVRTIIGIIPVLLIVSLIIGIVSTVVVRIK